MLTLVAFAAMAQAPVFAAEPGSVYGMKTYLNNAEFGFYPDKLAMFVPAGQDLSGVTMHVLKGTQEATGGAIEFTETPYPTFRMARFIATPTVSLAEPGDYVIEFRNGGTAFTRLPFKIAKKASGDQFNPTVSWDFITPVDKMASVTTSNSTDGPLWIGYWLAASREGIPARAAIKGSITSRGKVIGHLKDHIVQEMHNYRREFRMLAGTSGNAVLKKSDLSKLSGDMTVTLTTGGKTLRKFVWKIEGGKVSPLPRSLATHKPTTDYWIPRRLGTSSQGYQFFHLEEIYWASGG